MSGEQRVVRLVADRLLDEVSTVRSVINLARQQNLTYMAAAVAYYAFVSVLPLLLLTVAVTSFIGGDLLADRVIDLIGQQLSASGQQEVGQILTDSAGQGAASLVGFLLLTWSSLRLFRGLNQGVEEMYPNVPDSSLLEQFRDTFIVGTGLVFAITLVVVVNIVFSVSSLNVPLANVLSTVALVVVLTLALLPMYYVLPPVNTSVREILVGAVVAALGWVLLQAGFTVYVSNAGQYGAYGIIGTMLLFVTWLYFASLIVLLGAAVNAVRQQGGPQTE